MRRRARFGGDRSQNRFQISLARKYSCTTVVCTCVMCVQNVRNVPGGGEGGGRGVGTSRGQVEHRSVHWFKGTFD